MPKIATATGSKYRNSLKMQLHQAAMSYNLSAFQALAEIARDRYDSDVTTKVHRRLRPFGRYQIRNTFRSSLNSLDEYIRQNEQQYLTDPLETSLVKTTEAAAFKDLEHSFSQLGGEKLLKTIENYLDRYDENLTRMELAVAKRLKEIQQNKTK